jgi:glycine betaine/choline ABC-type transport system substrate-binding protein
MNQSPISYQCSYTPSMNTSEYMVTKKVAYQNPIKKWNNLKTYMKECRFKFSLSFIIKPLVSSIWVYDKLNSNYFNVILNK